jgi:hypothetical protein
MKIQLNLKEDQEIRKEVREIIVEQVKGIVRSEFHRIIKAEVIRIVEKYCDASWEENPVYAEIRTLASRELHRQWVRKANYKRVVQQYIDEMIEHDRNTFLPDKKEIEKIVKSKLLKKLSTEE